MKQGDRNLAYAVKGQVLLASANENGKITLPAAERGAKRGARGEDAAAGKEGGGAVPILRNLYA